MDCWIVGFGACRCSQIYWVLLTCIRFDKEAEHENTK